MRLREGTTGQKALFGALVGVFAFAFAVMLGSEARVVGKPDIGFRWFTHSGGSPGAFMPIRADVAEAGFISGLLLEVNGREVRGQYWDELVGTVRTTVGANNTVVLRGPEGEPLTVTVPVTRRTWADVWNTRRMYACVGIALFATGLLAFAVRPFGPASWALLCFGTFLGGYTCLVPWGRLDAPVYSVVGGLFAGMGGGATLHLTLAFPVEHRWIRGRPHRVLWCYLVGAACSATSLLLLRAAWNHDYPLADRLFLGLLGINMLVICLHMGRLAWFAVGGSDRLLRQRARILFLGAGLTFGSYLVVMFLQYVLNRRLDIDHEPFQLSWPLAFAYATVRYQLFDPRIVWRRAGALGLAAAAAVGVVWLGGQVSPALAAILLLPMLYVFPRYNARVNAWLYPKRAEFPALRRGIGDALLGSTTRDDVLQVLAGAVPQVCDTPGGAAFLLPGVAGTGERVSSSGATDVSDVRDLAEEPLVQMLVASHEPIKQESITVDPRFVHIRDASRACMDRLNASVLLPIEREGKVIGGLAVGAPTSGDVYDDAELDLLSELAHEAGRALVTAELREESGQADARSAEPGAGPGGDKASGGGREEGVSATQEVVPVAVAGGRYVVERLLGAGGYKQVYLAHDTTLERDVALALIRPEVLTAATRTRVQREAQAMAQLGDHPHIVGVYDLGETDGQVYIVSQYMPGGSLHDELEDAGAPLPIARAVQIGLDLCQALAHAHAHGIVHRDVKPENVWFSGGEAVAPGAEPGAGSGGSKGAAQLGDFGLALAAGQSRITRDHALVGTAAYMSPEQAGGDTPDARSDLYALGVVLYEMVTGGLPFTGADSLAILHQHRHAAPQSPTTHNPDIPRALNELIMALLEKEPAARPQTAAAVLEGLRHVGDGNAAAETRHPITEQLDAAAVSVSTSRPIAAEPFVGREVEVARAEGLLSEAVGGAGKVLLLVGEPGIGKTRLATECVALAEARGIRTLWGRCYEGEGAPAFWPWVQILRSYVRDANTEQLRAELGDGAPRVAQVVSDIRTRLPDVGDPPTVEGEAARFMLFDATTRFLKNAAAAQPLMLVLDDLHWADKSSLLLLQFLARELADAPLFVLGTYRDVEVDQKHPLAEVLGQLAREPVSARLHLGGLSTQAVVDLVEATGAQTDDANLAEQVYDHTEGNPFYIKETLRHLDETGGVMADMGVPDGVRDVIRLRLTRVSAACAQTLMAAAVIGRDFDDAVLARVREMATADLLEALDEAQRAGLIEDTQRHPARRRFVHALIRETLYDGLPTAERLQLHARVGAALETQHAGNPEPVLAVLAHHFCEAAQAGDNVEKAVDYCVQAAERATVQHAYDEAAADYERVLTLLDAQAPVNDARRCALLLAFGDALMNAGEPQRAEAEYTRLTDLARGLGDAATLVRAVNELGFIYRGVGIPQRWFVELIEEGLALLPEEDSAERAMLLANLSLAFKYYLEHQHRCAPLGHAALAMARRVGHPLALTCALFSQLDLMETPPDAKLPMATELADISKRLGRTDWRVLALNFQAGCHLRLGDVRAARESAGALIRLAEEVPLPLALYTAGKQHTAFALLEGRLDEAQHWAQRTLEAGLQSHAGNVHTVYPQHTFVLSWLRGDSGDWEAWYRPMLEALQQDNAIVRAILSLVDVMQGRRERARAVLDAFVAEAFRSALGNYYDTLWILAQCADVAAQVPHPRAAELLYAQLLPYADLAVGQGFNNFCVGAVAHWLGLLAATLERWDDAEGHFEAALEMNERMGARPWLANTQYEYARMLLARGHDADREKVRDLLTAAAATAEELGMPPLLRDARARLNEIA